MNIAEATEKDLERFWSKVEKTDSCWLWKAHKNSRNGYGEFNFKGKGEKAHRFSYELHIGPIPDGLELDHVKTRGCTNRDCVNPDHLEAVTHHENVLRGDAGVNTSAGWKMRTHCRNGLHELAPENIYYDKKGGRICKTCREITRQRRNKKRRQAH